MKKIKILLLTISSFFSVISISAQEYAVDRGASWLSGAISLSNHGGDLFEDYDGNRLTNFTLMQSFNEFIDKNFFVGGGLEWTIQAQGGDSFTTLGIGPQLGYAFGNETSNLYPYLGAGIRYYSMFFSYDDQNDDESVAGLNMVLVAGIILPVRSHIGFSIEAGYQVTSLDHKEHNVSYSGNTISITFGITGLFYK